MTNRLTIKQENFVLAYMECGNASEAYRRAYDAARMQEKTLHNKASLLLDNPKVKARLEVLRAPVIVKAQMTLEQHLADLARLRDLAEADGKYSAAISAEVARGKAAGLYIDKTELTGRDGGPLQVAKIERVIVDPKG